MEVMNELIQDGNGYSAKYALLSGGKNKKEYKKVSEMYTDLAIPAGLYVNSEDLENHVSIADTKSSGVMPEDLYSKLVLLATPMNKRKKMTRRKKVEKSEKKKGKKKTKRVTFNL